MTVVEKPAPGKGRTRGLNLAVFIKRANGVPMEEALAKTDEAGLVIASNKRMSKALVGSEEWKRIREVFACWTGTMTAYDKPDQKLGKIIEYTDSGTGVRYVFPVPEEQQGKKNVLLVAEHPNISLVKDGNDRIVQATEVDIVENFPTSKEGWFLGDQKCDIPHGDKADCSNQDARYLWRIDKRVGLVARVYNSGWDIDGWRIVVLGGGPSEAVGVAIEAASGGAPKKIESPYHTAPEQVVSIRGISPEDLKVLCESSAGEIDGLLRTVRPEALEATRRLLETLRMAENKVK